MKPKTRILLVCLESAEPRLLDEWTKSGDLPVLRLLMERGLTGNILNYPGFGNGAYGASFATGVNPGRHGRYFRWQAKPGTYQSVEYNEDTDLTQEPFWNVLGKAGKRVAIIDANKARLIDGLKGMQVADWMTHARGVAGPRSWPPDIMRDVLHRYGDDPFGGETDARGRTSEDYVKFAERMLERVETKTRMSLQYLKDGGWDLFFTSFADPHDIGHICWHLHDPGHPLHDADLARRMGDPVKAVYVKLDAALGKLVEAAGPNASVIVLTGPGMESSGHANHVLDEVLRRLEGLPWTDETTRVGRAKSLYRQLVPAGPRGLIRRFARRTGVTLPTELGGRKYFQVRHNENSGAIRLNVVGREPEGKIARGDAYDKFCKNLRRDLMELVDVVADEPLVADVVRVDDSCHGPYLDSLPDLFVIWRRTGPVSAVTSPKIGEIRRSYPGTRTGDHSPRGSIIVCGPRIAAGVVAETYDITAVAPTVTAMLGVDMPGIDGKAISVLNRAKKSA